MQCQRSRIHLPRKLAAKRQRNNSKAPKVVDGSLALATVPTEKVVVTAWQWTKSSQLVWCFVLKPLVSYGFHDTLSGSRRLSQILSGSTFHESWMNSEFYDPAFSTFPQEIPSRSSLVLFLPECKEAFPKQLLQLLTLPAPNARTRLDRWTSCQKSTWMERNPCAASSVISAKCPKSCWPLTTVWGMQGWAPMPCLTPCVGGAQHLAPELLKELDCNWVLTHGKTSDFTWFYTVYRFLDIPSWWWIEFD